MRTGFHGVGGPRMLRIFLGLLGSIVRFLLSRANLHFVEWQSREKSRQCSSQRDFSPLAPQQARAKDTRSAFLCIFATIFPQSYRVWRAFMHLVLLFVAFRLEKRTLSFCHCYNFRGVGGCGSLQWPVSGCATTGCRTPAGFFLLPALQKLWDWETLPVILASCHSKAEIALYL